MERKKNHFKKTYNVEEYLPLSVGASVLFHRSFEAP
jgi:hypothetical protein